MLGQRGQFMQYGGSMHSGHVGWEERRGRGVCAWAQAPTCPERCSSKCRRGDVSHDWMAAQAAASLALCQGLQACLHIGHQLPQLVGRDGRQPARRTGSSSCSWRRHASGRIA